MRKVWAISSLALLELYRRKDVYVLFILTALLTLLLGSIEIFHEDRIVRYLKEIVLLLIWISGLVIAITATARQIPAERENRTIFPLLAKPVSRAQFILGKFLGCWLASGGALAVFYIFFAVIAASRERQFFFLNYSEAWLLHWAMLGVIVAMTLLGSLVFAAPSSNATITGLAAIFILLLGRHLHAMALPLSEPARTLVSSIYFVMPHLEFFDVRDLVIHNLEPVPPLICLLAAAYAAAYTGAFLMASWVIFRRKPLS